MKKQNRIITRIEKIWDGLYKHRYIYGLLLILILTVSQISGSSIGAWKSMMNYDANEGVLVGKTRLIRSDEWAALTPMSFSQVFNGFNKTSEIVRGDSTDTSLVYALPSLDISQIFRPFQLGYFTGIMLGPELGNSMGLSFYWCARLIFLFLVTLDFFMIFTKKNKLLSTLAAMVVTFSPIIQWWFAVNGIAEIFIFGMGLVVATHNYLNVGVWSKDTWKKKILYLLAIFISMGSYALVLYPAWQIPMAYVFGVVWLYVVITNRKKLNKTNVLPYISSVLLVLVCLAIIILRSKDAISLVMNTAYPGKRVSTGGGMGIKDLFDYIVNVFLPYSGKEPGINRCETAAFITLFPLGLIAAIVRQIKKKRIDYLVAALVLIEFVIFMYCYVGVPGFIAKITLLSYTTPIRAMIAVGFIDIFLLFYELSMISMNNKRTNPKIIIGTILLSAAISTVCAMALSINFPGYAPTKLVVLMALVFAIINYTFFTYQRKISSIMFATLVSIITIISGFMVNPIRQGLDVVYNNELIKTTRAINEQEPGRWIVSMNDDRLSVQGKLLVADFLIMNGMPTINSVNTYPDLDRWSMFDNDDKYKDIYNRYAWIQVNFVDDVQNQSRFGLIQADAFYVNLTMSDLKKLEAKYVLTDKELNYDSLEERTSVSGWYIYEFKDI